MVSFARCRRHDPEERWIRGARTLGGPRGALLAAPAAREGERRGDALGGDDLHGALAGRAARMSTAYVEADAEVAPPLSAIVRAEIDCVVCEAEQARDPLRGERHAGAARGALDRRDVGAEHRRRLVAARLASNFEARAPEARSGLGRDQRGPGKRLTAARALSTSGDEDLAPRAQRPRTHGFSLHRPGPRGRVGARRRRSEFGGVEPGPIFGRSRGAGAPLDFTVCYRKVLGVHVRASSREMSTPREVAATHVPSAVTTTLCGSRWWSKSF